MPYTLERSGKVIEELLHGDKEKALEMHRALPECDLDGCDRKGGLNYHDGDYCSSLHHHFDR